MFLLLRYMCTMPVQTTPQQRGSRIAGSVALKNSVLAQNHHRFFDCDGNLRTNCFGPADRMQMRCTNKTTIFTFRVQFRVAFFVKDRAPLLPEWNI